MYAALATDVLQWLPIGCTAHDPECSDLPITFLSIQFSVLERLLNNNMA